MKEASIRNMVAWGTSLIVAWSFIHQGWLKFVPHEDALSGYAQKFQDWGYDPGLAPKIAIVEIVVGVLVLIPKTSSIGASLGALVMIGAIYTHLSTGIGSPVFAIILQVFCVSLVIMRWPESVLRNLFKTK